MLDLAGALKFLSQDEIKKIHNKSLEILKNIGVEVKNKEVLKLLKQKGVKIDKDKPIVYLSREVIENALDKAPSSVTLYSRDGKNNLHLSGTKVYTGTGGTAVNIYDLNSGERRRTRGGDIANIACLVENLVNIDFFVIPVFPDDFSKENADRVRFFNSLLFTNKHIMGGVYSLKGITEVIDFAEKIAGSDKKLREKPFISMITSIMSPLKMEEDYTGYLKYIVEKGIPVVAPPAPIAGATSPLTMAGTLAQMNAEALFGVVLTQLIKPGAKVLYGIVPTTMDLKTSSFRFGSIESGIMNAAGAQLAQFYNLPIYNTAGVSDSKLPDIETGYEKMANILLSALAGANFIHDAAGLIDTGLTVACEQYVIDNEILGMVKKVLQGIDINDERLALTDIGKVGPGGNFLTAPTTLKYMRSELYKQDLYNPERWEEWQQKGALSAAEKARKIAKEIIKKGLKPCLDKKIIADNNLPLIKESIKNDR